MAEINKAEVIKRIIDGCRLDTAREVIPKELAQKVVPVFIANEIGDIKVIQDDTLNSNNKIITVPDGKKWQVLSIFMDFTATATAGSRRIELFLRTANDDVFFNVFNSANITASQNRVLNWLPGAGLVTTSDDAYFIPLPSEVWLGEGMDIRIRTKSSVDVNDDMLIRILVKEFSIEG